METTKKIRMIKWCGVFLTIFVPRIFPLFRNKILIQHSFIKDNKIHVKIGGEHGGGSFKLSYQIANVSHINSTDNTVVFSILEAKDYRM